MSQQPKVCVFIMAGGSGERFWPLSRNRSPKQLLRLFSDETLLGLTIARVRNMVPAENLFILTNEAQLGPTGDALPDFPKSQILAEPAKRDTAPAAALATAIAWSQDPETITVLLPADQLIQDSAAFQKNLQAAIRHAADSGDLLTIAIKPTFPSTGFGYLQLGDTLPSDPGLPIRRVLRFVEKPARERAEEYLQLGGYAWNAGMFAWKASSFLAEARRHTPELAGFIENFPRGSHETYLREKFPLLPKISIDYAIMEKAASVAAVEAAFDWDDVGSWESLPSHLPADTAGNTVRGAAVLQQSQNNIVFSSGRTVALAGVQDLLVVETPDAVLVCHRSQLQNIKSLLPQLPPGLL